MDKTSMAVAVFDKRADQYQDKFMDVGLYHSTLDVFCDAVTKANARILDVACGPGNVTKYLLTKRPDFDLLGVDLSPNMLALATQNNPAAAFELMDCRDIGSLGTRYDGLMCGFGLPYLSKEEAVKLISDAATLLQLAGVLYLSTMEGDYNKSGFQTSSSGDSMYVHYHEAAYLLLALKENGFTIIDMQRVEYPPEGGMGTDLLIVARMHP